MNITRDYTKIGDKSSEGYLTLLIYPDERSTFTVHHPDKSGSTSVLVENDPHTINISLEGVNKPHILNINLTAPPERVELDGSVLSDTENYNFDSNRNKLIIKTGRYSTGRYTIFK